MNDLDIAQQHNMLDIESIEEKLGIKDKTFHYGNTISKIDYKKIDEDKHGKLILVTAMTPTAYGEGKSTVTIGLVDGLNRIGKQALGALREPSMGPVFGIKGGATGGGYTQIVPMEDINLHFTGDMHAITSAHNLISAALDNHIYFGNELNIDLNRIVWKRVLDINDRSLRDIEINIKKGMSYKSSFEITVASETMAIFCLSSDLEDFKDKISKAVVAYDVNGKEIMVSDLKVEGAVAAILKNALNPNLVQTLEGNPVLVHGGPFANIAHGCNSIIATKTAMKLGDYVVTEAGFGSDLGAEKFINIKSRMHQLPISTVVIVATIRALKAQGGSSEKQHSELDRIALEKGLYNLNQHVLNIKTQGLPLIVALNKFEEDTDEEIEFVKNYCDANNIPFSISNGYTEGGKGVEDLAQKVVEISEPTIPQYTYDLEDKIEDKINKVVKKVYGGRGINISDEIQAEIDRLNESEYRNFPICVAKTPNSLSDDPKKMVTNRNFIITIKDIKVNAGAGFIVIYTGNILTMPGLARKSSFEEIDVIDNKISGLF